MADLRHDAIDLAIRHARDTPPTADALRLFGETVMAVARHTLLEMDPPRGHLRPA